MYNVLLGNLPFHHMEYRSATLKRSIVNPGKFMLTLYKACTSRDDAQTHSVLTYHFCVKI